MTMDLIRGVRFAIVTMLLFGGAYPLAVWGLAQTAFRHQAQGSLIMRTDGSVIGSTLIAQSFEGDAYVHPRPSGVDYNAASTGGTWMKFPLRKCANAMRELEASRSASSWLSAQSAHTAAMTCGRCRFADGTKVST